MKKEKSPGAAAAASKPSKPVSKQTSNTNNVMSTDPEIKDLLKTLVARASTSPAGTSISATSTANANSRVENIGNANQVVSADAIAQAIIKAQQIQQEQPALQTPVESLPQMHVQPNQLALQQYACTPQYAFAPNNYHAMHNPALFQYHMLVGEQDLVRQQQAQRNNFMRLASMWRI